MLHPAQHAIRRVGLRPRHAYCLRQWAIASPRAYVLTKPRYYASKPPVDAPPKASILNPQPLVLPGSESVTAPPASKPLAPGPIASISPDSSSSFTTPPPPSSAASISPEEVPLAPPSPPPAPSPSKHQKNPPNASPLASIASAKSPSPPPSTPPPPPPPPASSPPSPPLSPSSPVAPRRRKPGRIRRFLTSLALLTSFGYALGVYYSLVNDNVHDFFTEYIPFGEDAVLYFEERQFRQRLAATANRGISSPRDPGNQVTIPTGSGISWRVAEVESPPPRPDSGPKAHHGSAALGENRKPGEKGDASPHAAPPLPEEKPPRTDNTGLEAASPIVKPLEADKAPAKEAEEPKKEEPVVLLPGPAKEAEPIQPAGPPIELLQSHDADDALVREVVKALNNIITAINEDHASARYSKAIESAKADISELGTKVKSLVDQTSEERLRATHAEFDQAAKELLKRWDAEISDQEARWQEEFEAERRKITQSYEEKLKTELERTKEIYDQRLQNELLEQAIALKRQFTDEVKQRVDEERNGRLSRLGELSHSVEELEKLTTGWNDVVDANLQTQRLHVAIEAVRAAIEDTDRQRPFLRELAALRETAADDPVVNTAIASINPSAYRYGLPTPAQIIDRFRRVAAEVRKAALVPDGAGAASHAVSVMLSKVLFQKQGLAAGDDVESILTRAETLLEEGDLDGAAREVNGLAGWAKTLSRDWLAEVRKVLEVRQALEVIAAEARLRSLQLEG